MNQNLKSEGSLKQNLESEGKRPNKKSEGNRKK